jgi:hypothetical protein
MKAIYHRPRPFWPHIVAAIGLALVMLVSTAQAQGMPPCLAFPSVVETLSEKYHEVPTGAGLVNEGAAVVLFAAPAGETWTLVVRKASGETCFLATGSNWVAQPLPATGKDG